MEALMFVALGVLLLVVALLWVAVLIQAVKASRKSRPATVRAPADPEWLNDEAKVDDAFWQIAKANSRDEEASS